MFGFHEKFWSGIFLFSLMSGTLKLRGEPVTERTPQTQGHSLSCYKCYSEVSWEDCDKNQNAVHCIPGYGDEVCTTVKRTWWVTINGSQNQTVSYSKNCDDAEGCTDEECRGIGRQCTLSVKCCSSSLCNTSVIESANFIFIAAFLCLAL